MNARARIARLEKLGAPSSYRMYDPRVADPDRLDAVLATLTDAQLKSIVAGATTPLAEILDAATLAEISECFA